MDTPINAIIVANRRREDFGDLEGLAESIRRFGLFHPIVVDIRDGLTYLVAGERRKRAAELLGWSEIPVRIYRDLSDNERREIELEENAKRKDLTPYEQSKNIVKLIEVAATVIKSSERLLIHRESKVTKITGRPKESANMRQIAKKIGISQPTISRAVNHVEAVEKYPELKLIPTQKDALTIAKNLDALPVTELEEMRNKLRKNDSDTLVKLAEKPPMRQREFASGESPGEKWAKLLYKNQSFLTSINHNGGIENLWKNWTEQERRSFYQSVCRMQEDFSNLRETMEEKLNYEEPEQNVRKDVA